jgi:hypothetical protein
VRSFCSGRIAHDGQGRRIVVFRDPEAAPASPAPAPSTVDDAVPKTAAAPAAALRWDSWRRALTVLGATLLYPVVGSAAILGAAGLSAAVLARRWWLSPHAGPGGKPITLSPRRGTERLRASGTHLDPPTG